MHPPSGKHLSGIPHNRIPGSPGFLTTESLALRDSVGLKPSGFRDWLHPYLLAAGALANLRMAYRALCALWCFLVSYPYASKLARDGNKKAPQLCCDAILVLRRDRDSNPGRLFTSTVFKTAAIDHSAISPNWVAKIDLFPISAKKVSLQPVILYPFAPSYQNLSSGKESGKRLRRLCRSPQS